jgi:hypothetical protein
MGMMDEWMDGLIDWVLGFELRAYTLSHSTSPFCEGLFKNFFWYWGLNSGYTLSHSSSLFFFFFFV